MEYFKAFLEKWQILVGAALGPFLAIILSVIWFWIKSKNKARKQYREYLRRIEISMTRSLDGTYKMREQLKQIAQRIKKLVSDSRAITNDSTFFLHRVNFPAVREVYRDIEIANFKVKSYYLHNKLLWIDAGIKEVNEITINFKNDFNDLMRQNEMLITLMGDKPKPAIQRKAYADNLEGFAKAIEDYISKHIPQGIEIMTQIKVYNERLRRRYYGYWFRWKQEGTKFKYFQNKNSQKSFARNLDSLDRIDKVIKEEVESAISEAESKVRNYAKCK